MSAVTVTSAQVRALTEFGADVVPGKAGATVTIGYLVTQESDGDWVHADADAVGSQSVLGVAVESFDGEDTVAEGNAVSVCISGPVSGLTPLRVHTTASSAMACTLRARLCSMSTCS
jgi:hypothetical protein